MKGRLTVRSVVETYARRLTDAYPDLAADIATEREEVLATIDVIDPERLARAVYKLWPGLAQGNVQKIIANYRDQPAISCGCVADFHLAAGGVCPACGHRDHGRSGCGERS